jgi:hypothetical protein
MSARRSHGKPQRKGTAVPVNQTQKMNLGPTLTKSVETIVALVKEHSGDPIDATLEIDGEDFDYWLMYVAVPEFVPGDERGIRKLLKEAPDLLGYAVALDDLYPMTAVTPGWFFGEACYEAVADDVRRQLGLDPAATTGHPLK